MKFPVPKLHVITSSAEAIDAGCDCVMLKFDGFPVTINCTGDGCAIYTDFHFKECQELIDRTQTIEPLTALLVGAKNRFNPVIYLYDTWWMDGVDLQRETYRSRYIMTRANAKRLDERFQVVTVLPIDAARNLWRDVMQEGYKGLVFRRSKDTAAGDLFIMRYYTESPMDFV